MRVPALDSQSRRFTMARAIVLISVIAVMATGSTVGGQEAALLFDGSTMRIYHNGNPVGEIVHPVGGPLWLGQNIYIGRWPSASTFPGFIDEVRIWDTVRTQAEIKRWMTLPLSEAEPGLLGYWRLDEGTGQTIVDASAFGNDGVLGLTIADEPEDP